MIEDFPSLDAMRAAFHWNVPETFNIADAVCDRHADGLGKPALILEHDDGTHTHTQTISFDQLKQDSCRLAHAFKSLGLNSGDRVAILLGQHYESVLCHLAAYRLGAIAVPMFRLFGPDALKFRLNDCDARILVTDVCGLASITTIRHELPGLAHVIAIDGDAGAASDGFWPLLARASNDPICKTTKADDPCLIIYTSGTTGPPKGAVHGHRVLLGHLPGVQMPHELFPQNGDCFYTPADWAWIGGLLDVLLPSLYFGKPVVGTSSSTNARFDPEKCLALMARHRVRNVFFPPAALRAIRSAGIDPQSKNVELRSIGSGGERLGDDLHSWAKDAFHVPINEFYGQTEANLVVSGMASKFERKRDAIGVAVPGHKVRVVRNDGTMADVNEIGEIAIRAEAEVGMPDPVVFLEYWRNPEATSEKFITDGIGDRWLLTGDLGSIDNDDHMTFEARKDDLINVSGYRIGPLEIEACLERHRAVFKAAVIGIEDDLGRGRIRAIVQRETSIQGDQNLAQRLRDHVRSNLAKHMAPHEIVFAESLPVTATGKLKRQDLRRKTKE